MTSFMVIGRSAMICSDPQCHLPEFARVESDSWNICEVLDGMLTEIAPRAVSAIAELHVSRCYRQVCLRSDRVLRFFCGFAQLPSEARLVSDKTPAWPERWRGFAKIENNLAAAASDRYRQGARNETVPVTDQDGLSCRLAPTGEEDRTRWQNYTDGRTDGPTVGRPTCIWGPWGYGRRGLSSALHSRRNLSTRLLVVQGPFNLAQLNCRPRHAAAVTPSALTAEFSFPAVYVRIFFHRSKLAKARPRPCFYGATMGD